MHDARDAYMQALKLCLNAKEQAFLNRRLAEVTQSLEMGDL